MDGQPLRGDHPTNATNVAANDRHTKEHAMTNANAKLDALPENARKLFVLYAEDAPNWSGTPLVGGNVGLLGEKQDRGLLTILKRAGLIVTQSEEGLAWVYFTLEGKQAAADLGIDLGLRL